MSPRAQAVALLRTPEIRRRRSMLAALLWLHRRHPAAASVRTLIAAERLELLGRRS